MESSAKGKAPAPHVDGAAAARHGVYTDVRETSAAHSSADSVSAAPHAFVRASAAGCAGARTTSAPSPCEESPSLQAGSLAAPRADSCACVLRRRLQLRMLCLRTIVQSATARTRVGSEWRREWHERDGSRRVQDLFTWAAHAFTCVCTSSSPSAADERESACDGRQADATNRSASVGMSTSSLNGRCLASSEGELSSRRSESAAGCAARCLSASQLREWCHALLPQLTIGVRQEMFELSASMAASSSTDASVTLGCKSDAAAASTSIAAASAPS
eukprot:5316122-Pleurochrysis_carterae.AAC.1